MPRSLPTRPPAAAVVACASFLLIGWSGLLVPSLIRAVKSAFDQTDAGMGVFYFVFATAWAIGSFGGGFATERVGRRSVLTLGSALLAVGLMGFGFATNWAVFLALAVPGGIGAGVIDAGANGLFLDLFPAGRGRALNLLHLFFSIGALAAPLAIGRLVEGGVGWQGILVISGLAAVPVAVGFGSVAMPSGRHVRGAASEATSTGIGRRAAAPLILLAVAISCYVAAELGVSSWLVRFLEPAPLTTATLALSLYWTGIAVGRLVSSQIADRFDHLRFATACAAAMSLALLGAILEPELGVSIALFAAAGVASGPVFPMIVAVGGDRYPDRSAAVSGLLGGMAVMGSIIYPPVMGFLSVTVGLTVAMVGSAVLGFACTGALILAGRSRGWAPTDIEARSLA